MDQYWEALYLAAKKALNPRVVSKFVEAGGVAAAVETVSGKSMSAFASIRPVRSASVRNEMQFFIC